MMRIPAGRDRKPGGVDATVELETGLGVVVVAPIAMASVLSMFGEELPNLVFT